MDDAFTVVYVSNLLRLKSVTCYLMEHVKMFAMNAQKQNLFV